MATGKSATVASFRLEGNGPIQKTDSNDARDRPVIVPWVMEVTFLPGFRLTRSPVSSLSMFQVCWSCD